MGGLARQERTGYDSDSDGGDPTPLVGGLALLGLVMGSRLAAPAPQTSAWTTARLSQERVPCVALTVGHKVLGAGGHRGAPTPKFCAAVDIYDPTTDH